MGLACYSPFPCMLFVINDELIRQVGVWLVYVVSFGSGIGVATSFLLPWAMLPDTIDHSEVTSGLRHEGLFCALFVFFGKLAAGLGLAGSSLMLEFAGFNSEFGGVQPPAVAMTLRILVGLVPMVLVCLSAGLLYFYPITEARRQLTRRQLAERQAKQAKQAKTGRRGSLQQNGIPVDRVGPTGFGAESIPPGAVGGKKAVSFSHLYIRKIFFYQDRRGTNIGKTQKQSTVFLQRRRQATAATV
jgi:hypothetical protein